MCVLVIASLYLTYTQPQTKNTLKKFLQSQLLLLTECFIVLKNANLLRVFQDDVLRLQWNAFAKAALKHFQSPLTAATHPSRLATTEHSPTINYSYPGQK